MDGGDQQISVGIAGYARSGKSTLTGELARRLDAPVASFGDMVRRRAQAEGLDPDDRQALMDFGHAWASDDPIGISAAVLEPYASAPVLIVDGIRHERVLETLRQLPGFHLVFVTVPEAVRAERLGGAIDPRQHPSEQDIPELEQRADIVVQSSDPVTQMVDAVLAAIPALNKRVRGTHP